MPKTNHALRERAEGRLRARAVRGGHPDTLARLVAAELRLGDPPKWLDQMAQHVMEEQTSAGRPDR